MVAGISYANVASTVAVLVAVVGGAYAMGASSGSGATIHACVKNRGGALRIVSSARRCRKHREHAISWNQRGPAGPPGATGGAGVGGQAGPAGAPGDPGAPGTNAATHVVMRQAPVEADCLSGERAVGGGGTPDNAALTSSQPVVTNGTPTGWKVTEASNGGLQFNATAYVICASP